MGADTTASPAGRARGSGPFPRRWPVETRPPDFRPRNMRFGTVAIVGRTNVGKSTFLNAVLGEPLAIVSARPQTTRDALLGVVHGPDAQIAFVDTPGLHRPRTELGRRMNATARGMVRS